MHRGQFFAASAFAGFARNKIALAVVLTIADIVNHALFSGEHYAGGRHQKHRAQNRNKRFLHACSFYNPFFERYYLAKYS
jgi:hypothetical protein